MRLLLVLLSLIPLTSSLCSLAHQVMGLNCAIMYLDSDCRGPFIPLDIGEEYPRFNSTLVTQKSVSSLVVRQNCLLEVFTRPFFGGSSVIYKPGVWKQLEDERFNDVISSARCFCTGFTKIGEGQFELGYLIK
ncbi:hypothetical protein L596_012319 [Steinernema carpocapsae]|uniref:Uncharacterized protein n=1 Tax=Steinernema carpocapsae TaxID=34508 RepID=A0A4U5NXC2_STECR|nr:hypothetical protein L596_012319 [Steinernema carpocapsae]